MNGRKQLVRELQRLRGHCGELTEAVVELRRRVARLEAPAADLPLARRVRAAHEQQVAGLDEGDHDFGPAFRRLMAAHDGRPR